MYVSMHVYKMYSCMYVCMLGVSAPCWQPFRLACIVSPRGPAFRYICNACMYVYKMYVYMYTRCMYICVHDVCMYVCMHARMLGVSMPCWQPFRLACVISPRGPAFRYVCMHVCVILYVYTICICTYNIHICTHACLESTHFWQPMLSGMYACMQVYMYAGIYVCRYAPHHLVAHTHIHTHTHAYIQGDPKRLRQPYVCTHTHTYMHTYMHTYIHTHIHTCMHTRRS